MLRSLGVALVACMLFVGMPARAGEREDYARALRATTTADAYAAQARTAARSDAGRLAIRDTFGHYAGLAPTLDAAMALAKEVSGGALATELALRTSLFPLANTPERFHALMGGDGPDPAGADALELSGYRWELARRRAATATSTADALAMARAAGHPQMRSMALIAAGRLATDAAAYLRFVDAMREMPGASPVSIRGALRATFADFAARSPSLAELGMLVEKAEPLLFAPRAGAAPVDATSLASLVPRLLGLDTEHAKELVVRALAIAPDAAAFRAGLATLDSSPFGPGIAALLAPGLQARHASFGEVLLALRLAAKGRAAPPEALVTLALATATTRAEVAEVLSALAPHPARARAAAQGVRERFLGLPFDGAASLRGFLEHAKMEKTDLAPVLRTELGRARTAAELASVAEAASGIDHATSVLTPDLLERFLTFRPPPTAGEAVKAMQAAGSDPALLLPLAARAREAATAASDLVATVEALGARSPAAQATFLAREREALTAHPFTRAQAAALIAAVRDPARQTEVAGRVLRALAPADYVHVAGSVPDGARAEAIRGSLLDFFRNRPSEKDVADLFAKAPESLRPHVLASALARPGTARELLDRVEAIAEHLPRALHGALADALASPEALGRFVATGPTVREVNRLNHGLSFPLSNRARERVLEAALPSLVHSSQLGDLVLVPYLQRSATHQAFLRETPCSGDGCAIAGVSFCADALRRVRQALSGSPL